MSWRRRPNASAHADARGLAIGFVGFGRAADAVLAAGEHADALVVAGGHHEPDPDVLLSITAPTLLIAAGEDPSSSAGCAMPARSCATARRTPSSCPGATHGFPQARAPEMVAHATQRWFGAHLASVE